LNENKRHAGIAGHGGKEPLEGVEPARRCPDTDDGETGVARGDGRRPAVAVGRFVPAAAIGRFLPAAAIGRFLPAARLRAIGFFFAMMTPTGAASALT
jgi:hypothetical protein